MRNAKKTMLAMLVIFSTLMLLSCSKENDKDDNGNNKSDCFVQLFDGDNYTDDNIIVKGPGEYSDLKNLPGANKNWTNEADSFKSGKNTTVTFYSEINFQGESVTFKNGEEKSSMNEPSSMKITCK